MKLLVVEGLQTTHAPEPRFSSIGPHTMCGLPRMGHRRTGTLIETEGPSPSCKRCRELMWRRARVGQA